MWDTDFLESFVEGYLSNDINLTTTWAIDLEQ